MAILIIALLISALSITFAIQYVKKAFTAIDQLLDRILAKDPTLKDHITGETRISKLAHKASRIMDMYTATAQQSTQEKETVQGFIADMSHQMKTPLASIHMYTDLLLESEENDFLNRIKASTQSLEWIMNGLIKLSRLETGAIELAPICADIKPTIATAIGHVFAQGQQKNITITQHLHNTPLLHDKNWTREAMVNILENAIKYSPQNGHITITIDPLPTYTKVTITNTGMGIHKGDYHKIFKRFYRGENAKNAQGAGIGLYLATLIMEKQGGYIMVDSKVGEYAAFSLFFQNGGNIPMGHANI